MHMSKDKWTVIVTNKLMTVFKKQLYPSGNYIQRYFWWLAVPVAVIGLLVVKTVAKEMK